MNFIKRGITSIIRKPGKTIILLLIVFILGNIICGAISIQQAVENTDKNLRSKMSPVVTLGTDDDELMKRYDAGEEDIWENIENITPDTINKIGQISYVDHYDYISQTYLYSKDLNPYSEYEDNYYDSMFSFTCMGGQDPEIFDLKEDKIKMASGRTFSDDEINNLAYVAIISQNLADANNLTVGSKITLDNIFYNDSFYEGNYDTYDEEYIEAMQSYEFEVIGIFEPVAKTGQSDDGGLDFGYDQELQNTIYTTNKVVEADNQFSNSQYEKLYGEEVADNSYYEAYYVLSDPLDLDAFKDQAQELLPEFYIVSDSSDSYEDVVAPMRTIQNIAKIVLYVAVGASLVILSLLIILFLRDRKHEISIYLSLGERKIKIVSQIVLEVVLIAVVSIALSLFSGNILAGTVSQTMLDDQILAQLEDDDGSYTISNLEYRGYGNNISTEDLTESYNVSLNGTTVLLFFAVGIGTVIVSTLVPIIYIIRLNPKKIMM